MAFVLLKKSVSLGACFAVVTAALSGASLPASSSDIVPTIVNWNLTAAQITTQCAAAIAKARASVAALQASSGTHTFANTVLPLENLNSDLSDETVAQTFLAEVSPDKSVRDASQACQNDEAAFGADSTAVPAIYRDLLAAKKSGTARNDADRALTDLWVQAYQRSGAGLPAKQRAEFVALSKQLADMQTQFDQNYASDATTIVIAKDESAGLPSDFLASLKGAANGGFVVPVNDSTISVVLDNASVEAVRERYYMAFENKQADANVKLLQRAIGVRYRLARLMGYSSWAAYQMAPRVDTSPQHMQAFLSQLDAHLLPKAREDIATLTALKQSQTGDPKAVVRAWDVLYYLNQLKKTKYALDDNQVRQYFPAPHVVDSILSIYQKLLGVRFTPVVPANKWYPNVTEFAVSDTASGRFIGTFLLDLYPRPGKPGGAFNDPILSVRRRPDGSYRPPISAMVVSDWPAPLGGKPALLTHDDVVTFFHEFGHCMAALLTTAPYESLTQFQQDFVEAPSQMLENFTWNPTVLKQISSNVDTGAPLPDALIQKMIAARCTTDRLCNAYAATRQIMLSVVDLDYHTGGPNVDTTAIWAKVARTMTPVGMASGTHPQAQFTHLMSGYDAGYYVYLWSLVYAQDMFTAFQKGGLENPVVGMRYRKSILEPARTYDPNVEVRNFLGRPMDPAAFYAGFDRANATP